MTLLTSADAVQRRRHNFMSIRLLTAQSRSQQILNLRSGALTEQRSELQ